MKQQFNEVINKTTALYCRLSREDEYTGDSASIQTQKMMLKQYADDHNFVNCEYFVDDGYSGTNFNRPDFQNMLLQIEEGKIGTVIVKDLSRLGRNYLQTGFYIENYFPQQDVRFIAVNDGIDTSIDENEFAPFKNIINEWYARDISRKVRSALKTKALNGDFTGSEAPFGYMKSPEDKHKLIPSEYAPIVQEMFQMALEGKTCTNIATTLTNRHITVPSACRKDTNGNIKKADWVEFPYLWRKGTILKILQNPVYTGDMVSHKKGRKSFKNKKSVYFPEESWIRVLNTHEPLVSREDFETVQKRLNNKKPAPTQNPENIFRGLLKCGECGRAFTFLKKRSENGNHSYKCNRSKTYGKAYCAPHKISLPDLYNIVLDDINRHIKLVNEDKAKYINSLADFTNTNKDQKSINTQKELKKISTRISEIEKIIQSMYEDKVFGRITAERYSTLSASLEAEEADLKEKLNSIQTKIAETKQQTKSMKDFADLIEQYAPIKQLTPELLNTLIEKIIIHEQVIENNKTTLSVEIYYRFIGSIGNKPINGNG